jgi:alpha-1,2-mannosyltransferase
LVLACCLGHYAARVPAPELRSLRIRTPRDAIFTVGALALSVVVLWWSWHLQRQTDWLDLRIYRNAINYWRHGNQLYDFAQPGTRNHLGFTYPPFGAFILAPLAVAPLRVAEWGFTLINLTICCVAGSTFALSLARRLAVPAWPSAILGSALVLGMEPIRESLGFGQINIVLLALVLLDMWLLSTNRRGGGIAIGLATAIKLTPIVLIIALLANRRTAAARRAAITFAVASIVAALVAPSTSLRYWLHEVQQTSRVGHPARVSNQSWAGVVARFERTAEPSTAAWFAGAVLAVVVAIVFARKATGWWPVVRVLSVAGAAATMASPISWTHHFYWSIPAVAALIYHAAATRSKISIAAAITVYAMFATGPMRLGHMTRGWGHWTWVVSCDLYLYATLITCAVLIFGPTPQRVDSQKERRPTARSFAR